jgi:hypothetical protein
MTISVKINNFRKVQQAEFEIAPIAFLVGENENGKSRVAQAVALAAAQQPLPKNITKKDAKQLVHQGQKSGKVELTRGDVASEISWPLAEFKHTGQGKPIYASEFAVGLRSVFGLSNAEKVSYFIQLLKANPTLDDLKLVLPKSLDAKLEGIWKQIQESGWDEAHSSAKQEEAELTGKWKMTTREDRWNVDKAGKWRPETWEQDLERAERTELEVAYAEGKKLYEDALKAEGATQFDRSQAEAIIAEKPNLDNRKVELEQALQHAKKEENEVRKLLSTLPPVDTNGMPCPECGAKLLYQPSSDLLSKGSLTKAESISEAEKTSRQQEIDEANADLKTAIARIEETQKALADIYSRIKAIDEASRKLSEQDKNTPVNTADIDSGNAHANYKNREQRLDDFNRVHQAKALYDQIITQKELVAALHQGGVRKTKLDEQIKRFNNDVLKPLSNKFGSEIIWIDNDLNMLRGNYQYYLLSRSARYCVRTVLQVAIAMADKSELLVIDDVDEINDRNKRGGLLSMVISSGIPALLCMAKRPEENAPDLSIRGDGNTYVVSAGVVTPISETKEVKVA